MKLIDLEVSQIQKNKTARQFLESQHRVTADIDPATRQDLTGKVRKLKEEQYYSRSNFHMDPAYTKLVMIDQLLKHSDSKDVVTEHDAPIAEESLEQAELILAVQDVVNDIMSMAENLASMQVQKMMPVVAKMKTVFSMEQAQAFELTVDMALGTALETIKATHDQMTDAVAVLQGQAPANTVPMASSDEVVSAADSTAGIDAASGPVDEPLGRGKKD